MIFSTEFDLGLGLGIKSAYISLHCKQSSFLPQTQRVRRNVVNCAHSSRSFAAQPYTFMFASNFHVSDRN